MINRYGHCPNPECNTEWDGGDILENLKKLDALGGKPDEDLSNLAFKCFGYSALNKKHFSRVIAVTFVGDSGFRININSTSPEAAIEPHIYMCPSCRQVWDAETGKFYESIHKAKLELYEHNSGELLEGNKI